MPPSLFSFTSLTRVWLGHGRTKKKIPKKPEYIIKLKQPKRVHSEAEEEYEEQRPGAEYVPGSDEVSFASILIFFLGV